MAANTRPGIRATKIIFPALIKEITAKAVKIRLRQNRYILAKKEVAINVLNFARIYNEALRKDLSRLMLRPSFSPETKNAAAIVDALIAREKAHKNIKHLIGALAKFLKASEQMNSTERMKADYVPTAAANILQNLMLLSSAKKQPFFLRRAARMERLKQ